MRHAVAPGSGRSCISPRRCMLKGDSVMAQGSYLPVLRSESSCLNSRARRDIFHLHKVDPVETYWIVRDIVCKSWYSCELEPARIPSFNSLFIVEAERQDISCETSFDSLWDDSRGKGISWCIEQAYGGKTMILSEQEDMSSVETIQEDTHTWETEDLDLTSTTSPSRTL